ncbi:MAG: NAD(P)H-binding protein [Vicinamibacterales bacterium]
MFCEHSATVLAAAACKAGIVRLGAISAAGVADSEPLLPAAMRWLLRHSTIGPMYADLARMEHVYGSSGLDWFAVRPVTLINGAPSRRAKEVPRFGMTSVIGRADVAGFLLSMLEQPNHVSSRTPLIGWW